MDSVFLAGVSGTAPIPAAVPLLGHPQSGNPGGGVPATKPGPWWFYMVTQELRNVVVGAGLVPDHEEVSQVVQAIQTMIASAVAGVGTSGSYKGLKVSASGLGGDVSVSADELVVSSGASRRTLTGVALATINAANAGANGLDAGAVAASTWYSVWVIWNGATVAGLLSLSATAPTMPAGYTHKARVGWIRTDGTASKFPIGFTQRGRSVQILVAAGGNMPALPIMAAGLSGDPISPSWVSIDTSAFVPPTGAKIYLALRAANTGSVMCAPNAAYGNVHSVSNPAPASMTVSATTFGGVMRVEMLLETTDIFWASDLATNLLACTGWEDNL